MDGILKAKGKNVVDSHYNEVLHSDLTPSQFLKAMSSQGVDTTDLMATKHIKQHLAYRRVKTESSNKKLAKFSSEVTPNKKARIEESKIQTTKKDYKIVSFRGQMEGSTRRFGFCYINLNRGFHSTFSFGSDGQSIVVKITQPGYFWKDLIHSAYVLPKLERMVEKDPYKIALSDVFSPLAETSLLVIDVGEEIMEATDKKVELKKSEDEEETWDIYCVPFLYKDSTFENCFETP